MFSLLLSFPLLAAVQVRHTTQSSRYIAGSQDLCLPAIDKMLVDPVRASRHEIHANKGGDGLGGATWSVHDKQPAFGAVTNGAHD